MSVLANIKAEAARNPHYGWSDAKISAKDFDPEEWMKWSAEIGMQIHPWGSGYGWSEPNGRNNSIILMGALREGRGGAAKERKLVRYLRSKVPANYEAFELNVAARQLLAEHAANLPCVPHSKYHASKDLIIPNYLFETEQLEGMGYSAEFVAKKTAELSARKAAWEHEIQTAAPERKAELIKSFEAWQRAMELFEQERAAQILAVKQMKALRAELKADTTAKRTSTRTQRKPQLQHAA